MQVNPPRLRLPVGERAAQLLVVTARVATLAAQVTHRARRIGQTPHTFANWRAVLADMSPGLRTAHSELTFVTRDGLRLSCPNQPGARVPIYEVCAEDAYRLSWLLDPLGTGPMRVVDIGAHVGAFACRVAQLRPHATFECYEPSAATARYLERNLAENGYAARSSVHEAAVASTSGTAWFADNGAGSALNELVQDPAAGSTVRTVGFDEVVAGDERPVDLLKIDCEGGEYDIVFGSTAGAWSRVRRVVLEYHPTGDWRALLECLRSRGFVLVAREPASDRQGTAWLANDAAGR